MRATPVRLPTDGHAALLPAVEQLVHAVWDLPVRREQAFIHTDVLQHGSRIRHQLGVHPGSFVADPADAGRHARHNALRCRLPHGEGRVRSLVRLLHAAPFPQQVLATLVRFLADARRVEISRAQADAVVAGVVQLLQAMPLVLLPNDVRVPLREVVLAASAVACSALEPALTARRLFGLQPYADIEVPVHLRVMVELEALG